MSRRTAMLIERIICVTVIIIGLWYLWVRNQ